jgi:hypothetical protein
MTFNRKCFFCCCFATPKPSVFFNTTILRNRYKLNFECVFSFFSVNYISHSSHSFIIAI